MFSRSLLMPVQNSRQRWWSRFVERWNELQVGRQGSYSVERLESFDRYCRTTSLVRAVLVCILAPLPALFIAILLELLPLCPPSEGWAANWMFWIRLTLSTLSMSFVGISQLVTTVPDLHPTFWKRQIIAWGATAAYVGNFVLVASNIVFPIPFMWYMGGVLMGLYIPVMQLITFGAEPFRKTSSCHRNLQRYLNYFNTYMALMNIFPICKVLYDFVPATHRGIAVIVLPIWRFVAKQILVKSTRDMEDFMPGLVSMTVDFYSALFVSSCMSTKGSRYLSALFIAADIGQSLVEFREVRANANIVLDLVQTRKCFSKHWIFSNTSKSTTLVDFILDVTRNPTAFHVSTFGGVRLRACYPHPLAPEQKEKLDSLEASHVYTSFAPAAIIHSQQSQKHRRHRWRPHRRIHVERATISPKTTHIKEVETPVTDFADESLRDTFSVNQNVNDTLQRHAASSEVSRNLVAQGLQLLFHCEYLVLVEYVECVVPLIYVLYKAVLEELPNVVYYPGGAGNFGSASVVSIILFAILEISSLLFLHFFLQRKFAVSAVYQLAFVLETQIYLVQGNFFVGTLVLLQYELEHFGTDFTFQFKWLRGEKLGYTSGV